MNAVSADRAEDETSFSFEMAAATDIGRIRSRNEDAWRIVPEAGLAILSDGMGGHRAGNVASRMAVEIIGDELLDGDDATVTPAQLINSLELANDSIRDVAQSEPDCQGMGATVVVARFQESKILVAHAGDSRLYRFWKDELELLTEDHTLAQQYVREGIMEQADADRWIGRNMLVKGLGIDTEVDPDVTEVDLAADQVYLLCSDGLTDAISNQDIAAILREHGDSLQNAVDRLIDAANDNGGPDNITVILTRVSTTPGGD